MAALLLLAMATLPQLTLEPHRRLACFLAEATATREKFLPTLFEGAMATVTLLLLLRALLELLIQHLTQKLPLQMHLPVKESVLVAMMTAQSFRVATAVLPLLSLTMAKATSLALFVVMAVAREQLAVLLAALPTTLRATAALLAQEKPILEATAMADRSSRLLLALGEHASAGRAVGILSLLIAQAIATLLAPAPLLVNANAPVGTATAHLFVLARAILVQALALPIAVAKVTTPLLALIAGLPDAHRPQQSIHVAAVLLPATAYLLPLVTDPTFFL